MNFAEHLQKTVWQKRGAAGWGGYAALLPLSLLFGFGVSLRNLGFRVGVLRTEIPALPVISVGNLAVGGTGKTPFTLWLSRELQTRGLRVGILLRGYRGRRSRVTIISRGSGPEVGPEVGGDEAVMLARNFSGPVLTAPRRMEGVKAAADLGCEVVVLDDGFQHRAIGRAVDLVLLDDRRGALLPAGPLRERLRALRRADAVILVQDDPTGRPTKAPRMRVKKPVYQMQFVPTALMEAVAGSWQNHPVRELAAKRVVVVSGIARPERFYRLLGQWDVVIQEVFEYPDHHRYTATDWLEIARCSQTADLVVTTEKDLVKLESFPFANGKLVALRIEARVDGGDELIAGVLQKIEQARAARTEPPPATAQEEANGHQL
jgi:tetraacyldisaccharide 4'-kinase